jgi:N-acetyltransferase 10
MHFAGINSDADESDSQGDAQKRPATGAVLNGDAQNDAPDTLHEETLKPREMTDLPPLFLKLEERRAERLHYVGVSYGLTQQLLRFWQKLGFVPLYLRQTPSDITGEHTCIMLKALASEEFQGLVRQASFFTASGP